HIPIEHKRSTEDLVLLWREDYPMIDVFGAPPARSTPPFRGASADGNGAKRVIATAYGLEPPAERSPIRTPLALDTQVPKFDQRGPITPQSVCPTRLAGYSRIKADLVRLKKYLTSSEYERAMKTIEAARLIDLNAERIASAPNQRREVCRLIGQYPSSGFDSESEDTV